jgi:hypothetical protein
MNGDEMPPEINEPVLSRRHLREQLAVGETGETGSQRGPG